MTDPAEFVSFVVPTADDAPEVVQATITSLLALDLPAYEVLVVDAGTRDEALWRPVEEFCRSYGVEFRHVAAAAASRAEAVRFAGLLTHPRSERVEVVEPGQRYGAAAAVPPAVLPAEPGSPRRGVVAAALLVLAASAVGGIAIAGDLIPDSEPGVSRPAEARETPGTAVSAPGEPPQEIPPTAPPFVPLPLASPSTSPLARPASAPAAAPTAAPVRVGSTGGQAPAPRPPGTTTATPPPAAPAPSTPAPAPPPSQQPQPQPTASEAPPAPSPSPTPSRKPKRRG